MLRWVFDCDCFGLWIDDWCQFSDEMIFLFMFLFGIFFNDGIKLFVFYCLGYIWYGECQNSVGVGLDLNLSLCFILMELIDVILFCWDIIEVVVIWFDLECN